MTDIVPATRALLEQAMPGIPKTVRAIAMVKDDRVIAVGGYYVDDARLFLFASIEDEARAEPRCLLRASKILLAMARRRHLPMHATPDPEVAASVRFMLHLGFRPVRGPLFELGA